ncbi:MAG: hypothetical protein FWE59_05310 [Oscillospiraceae bacterium]|nr:hypothetical protein [Oscillospiraceae bacterium]
MATATAMAMARVTILAGHYGSGKTNLAVNLSLALRRKRPRVAIADLDIVNPYYRTMDAKDWLMGAGIDVIASSLALSNLDAPSLNAAAARIFDDPGLSAIADVGGDDRGALALGRYAARLGAPDCRILFVFNPYRPRTATAGDALAVLREIEAAGHFAFTGIANNANLGPITTAGDVLASLPVAGELSRLSGLPIALTSLKSDLAPALEGKADNIFPMEIIKKPEWII